MFVPSVALWQSIQRLHDHCYLRRDTTIVFVVVWDRRQGQTRVSRRLRAAKKASKKLCRLRLKLQSYVLLNTLLLFVSLTNAYLAVEHGYQRLQHTSTDYRLPEFSHILHAVSNLMLYSCTM